MGRFPAPKPALPKIPISDIDTNKQHRERRLWNQICWWWWSLLIGNDHNYRKRLWNQPIENNSQSATEKTIPMLWLAESIHMTILSWRARFKLINNAVKCREIAKIYAKSKLIGPIEKPWNTGTAKTELQYSGGLVCLVIDIKWETEF